MNRVFWRALRLAARPTIDRDGLRVRSVSPENLHEGRWLANTHGVFEQPHEETELLERVVKDTSTLQGHRGNDGDHYQWVWS